MTAATVFLTLAVLATYYAVGTVVSSMLGDEIFDRENDRLLMAVIALWPLVVLAFLLCLPVRGARRAIQYFKNRGKRRENH